MDLAWADDGWRNFNAIPSPKRVGGWHVPPFDRNWYGWAMLPDGDWSVILRI